MHNIESLKKQVLEECDEDHVGLWSVVRTVQEFLGTQESKYVKCLTFVLLNDLLASGEIQAGFPAPNGRGFTPWNMPVDSVIRQIDVEWQKLGRDPNIGEIVWFTTFDPRPVPR